MAAAGKPFPGQFHLEVLFMFGPSRARPRRRLLACMATAIALSAAVTAPATAGASGGASPPVDAADICATINLPVLGSKQVCFPAPSVAPTVMTPPSVAGTPREGSEITCGGASFGRPTITINLPDWLNGFPLYIADPQIQLSILGSPASEWRKDGSAAGAVSGARTLNASDVGSQYTCATTAVGGVSLTIFGFNFGTIETGRVTTASNAVTVSPLPLTNNSAPTISGNAVEGSTLTCSAGSWTPSPESSSLTWTRAGADVGTGPSYALKAADIGKAITCREDVSRLGQTGSASSAAKTVSAMALTNQTPPAISGTAQAGSTLTCAPGAWSPSPESSSLKWLRDGSEVGTGATHLLTAADVGKAIVCREEVSRQGVSNSADSESKTPTAKPANNNNQPGNNNKPGNNNNTPANNTPANNVPQGGSTPSGVTPPTGGVLGNTGSSKGTAKKSTGRRAKAMKACSKKFRAKKGKKLSASAKKKRAACLKKARKLPA